MNGMNQRKRKHGSEKFPDIESKIRSGEYTCRLPADPKKHKATTWKSIRYIYDEADQILPDFYFCSKCHIIFNLKLRDSGKSLKSHVDNNCFGRAASIDAFFVPEYQPAKKRRISTDDKKSVRDAAVGFVVQDMRPISAVNGEGITELMSIMTFIGAKYGSLSKEAIAELKLIPSRQTVGILLNLS